MMIKNTAQTVIKSLAVGLIVTFGVLSTTIAHAATISSSPATVNVSQGQEFTRVLNLNPAGDSVYTAKIEVRFPANLVEVRSFSFGNGWMQLAQPGYDEIDNQNGVLVKTAGYPGGLSSQAQFGVITFRSIGAGTGNIVISTGSAAYDQNSQNILTDVPVTASVTVAAPAPVEPDPTPEDTLETNTTEPVQQVEEGTVSESTEETEDVSDENVSTEDTSALAAVGAGLSLGTGSIFLGTLVLLVLVVLIWYLHRSVSGRKKGE